MLPGSDGRGHELHAAGLVAERPLQRPVRAPTVANVVASSHRPADAPERDGDDREDTCHRILVGSSSGLAGEREAVGPTGYWALQRWLAGVRWHTVPMPELPAYRGGVTLAMSVSTDKKWYASSAKESAGAKEHFIDLCRMLGYQTPNEADPTGDWYAFEKGAEKTDGGDGFADVWKRGHFAWEYRGKKKDLKAAYAQLLEYREALESPPLLVVCDLDRFEVHTNFTGTVKEVHRAASKSRPGGPGAPRRG
jgi:hypothetical protein